LREYHKEPFDLAVDEALSSEDREIFQQFQVLEEEAFDPALRSNGAVVVDQNGNKIHIRRGSPEYFVEAGLVHKDQVATWLEEEERLGHRILGVSYDYGHGARFGGFVAFSDSVKSTTKATLEAAKKLNVAITVITGDSFLVAKAVGQEVGLINDDSEVIEASRFFALSYTEQRKLMGKIRVFARTTPEQKLTLIQLLKEKYTVGFLGEGINDAPALKASHVAMVVQSASDVARETADIILLKSNLGVIVEGIRLGRETHANTLKYIRATLVSNFGNFYAVAIGSLFISFLPMLPKQILLLNLLSDLPMIAIAFDRVSNKEVSRPQRYNFKSLYIIFITLGLVSTVFDFMWFALFYQISPGVLQTNWFIASAITEILLLFSIRSMLPIRESGRPAPILIYLSVGAVGLAVLLPIIPVTAAFFSFTTPSAGHLTLILALSLLYVVVSEMVKRPVARFIKAT
jgi:Mg2+-importing ATPase